MKRHKWQSCKCDGLIKRNVVDASNPLLLSKATVSLRCVSSGRGSSLATAHAHTPVSACTVRSRGASLRAHGSSPVSADSLCVLLLLRLLSVRSWTGGSGDFSLFPTLLFCERRGGETLFSPLFLTHTPQLVVSLSLSWKYAAVQHAPLLPLLFSDFTRWIISLWKYTRVGSGCAAEAPGMLWPKASSSRSSLGPRGPVFVFIPSPNQI